MVGLTLLSITATVALVMNNGINTDNGGSGWLDGSPYAYYGAIVFQLTGTSVTLRQGVIPWGGADIASQYSNQYLNNAWFTAGTTLPETKIKQPVRKTTEVHYHYDKTENIVKIRTI